MMTVDYIGKKFTLYFPHGALLLIAGFVSPHRLSVVHTAIRLLVSSNDSLSLKYLPWPAAAIFIP